MCIFGLLMKSPQHKKDEELKTSSSVFNLKVFRNISFVFFCLNNSFFFFGQSIISVHLPAYAMSLNISQHKAAYLVSISGISSSCGRFFGSGLSLSHRLSSINVYVICMALSSAATFLSPIAHDYILIALYSGVLSFLVGCFCVKLPDIVIQILNMKLLASGWGYMLMFEAFGALLGPPIAGKLRPNCNHYPFTV